MKLRLPFGGLIDAYGNIGDASPPFFISSEKENDSSDLATWPNINWRRAYKPDNDPSYSGNKEQESSLFLKIKPIRENIFHQTGTEDMEGIFITRTILATRVIDGPPSYIEQDWGLTVAVSECDIKHRPWENIEIELEMKVTTPDGETFYNETLNLDSTNFAITPAYSGNPPTGYLSNLRRFYKTSGVLGTDTTADPYLNTRIEGITSVTPSSSNEPPTPA
jgi:hypothetical protein